jgi:hypothetical protein
MSVPPARPQLDYAPPPSRLSRLRRFVLPLILVALAILLARLGMRYWPVFQAYRAYRACAEYSAPPTHVVASTDPAVITALAGSAPGYQRGNFGLAYVPPVWTKLYARLTQLGFLSEGTAFLHERRSPNGMRLLISVDLLSPRSGTLMFFVRRFSPATPFQLAGERISFDGLERIWIGDRNFRLFAGQPDLNDASHFTIPFDYDGEPGIIDGWVRDDTSVFLELRMPVTQPAPSRD